MALNHEPSRDFFAEAWFNLCSAEAELITGAAAAILHSPAESSSLLGARPGLFYTHLFAQEFLTVKALNRCLGLRGRCHFNKAKTPGLATILVFDDFRRGYLAEGFKSLPNRLVSYLGG